MFNALRYTKELEKAGFTREQAEALVNIFWDIVDMNIATKDDVTKLKDDISKLEAKFEAKFETLEYRLTIKMGAMLILAVSVLATLIKIL